MPLEILIQQKQCESFKMMSSKSLSENTKVLAFVVCRNENLGDVHSSTAHLKSLAKQHSLYYAEIVLGNVLVGFVSRNDYRNFSFKDEIQLTVGSHETLSLEQDRFLLVQVTTHGIAFKSDYAGSIPVFYSFRIGFVASNIEKCVTKATKVSLADIDYESLYGFMRFGHFIWDETAWKHIKQLLPNRKTHVRPDSTVVKVEKMNQTFVKSDRKHMSLNSVATELYELNRNLITDSLRNSESILLPLSSGYDSRMIFSVLAENDTFRERLTCFTYGNMGALEVEAAKKLCANANVQWSHVDLPSNFLKKNYLLDTANIFGSSMHMHAMYQFEVIEVLERMMLMPSNCTLTTGFMTGVPAGQHNRLLNIQSTNSKLTHAMNSFSQSRVWEKQELERLAVFHAKNFEESCEAKFQLAFNDFDGELHQKAILFDIWTRQRNFISYHPRILEWFRPVSSPHMNPEYINFFLSLKPEHLNDRRAVQAMFKLKYRPASRVVSDSNLFRGMGPKLKTAAFLTPQLLSKLGIKCQSFLGFYTNDPEFDLKAVIDAGRESFFPILEASLNSDLTELINTFGGISFFEGLYLSAFQGDLEAYLKVTTVQSIALALND
jgi:hypothetical protein